MTGRELRARRLITADGVVEYPRMVITGEGRIGLIEPGSPCEETTVIGPAFFDVHVHGAAGHDVMEGTVEAVANVGRFLGTRGVGNFLATTVTAPVDRTLRALEGIAEAIDEAARDDGGAEARPVGIHLEGPFISHAKRGVHPPADIQKPSVDLFKRMQEAARGHIRLITIAPEVEGAGELIAYATAERVRVTLGHSDATAAEARAGIKAGAASATHTFNAMRRLDHREPGICGVVLDEKALYAELICDGIHVAPEFVRLWLRMKGEGRAILVTDGISATGMPDGDYMLGEFEVTVKEGRCLATADLAKGVETLAGSVLTMDRAIANLQRFAGVELDIAVRLASRNPARMVGMSELDGIAVGAPASFNVFSADGALQDTILCGRSVRNT